MQFDFQPIPSRKQSAYLRHSKGLQQIINQLDNRSDRQHDSPGIHTRGQSGSNHPHQPSSSQLVDFGDFNNIEPSQSMTESFTSEMFNKPKNDNNQEMNGGENEVVRNNYLQNDYEQPSIPESQKPTAGHHQNRSSENDGQSSRNINEISYLYSDDQSFRFERSMSFVDENDGQIAGQNGNKNNQRFQRLKNLLSKAKQNNIDDFYKMIDQQKQNQQIKGNLQFQSKKQFTDYARNLKYEKRAKQTEYIEKQRAEALAYRNSPPKNQKASLFGEKAADAFKKKNEVVGFNILPPEYTQEEQYEEDFYNDRFRNGRENNKEGNEGGRNDGGDDQGFDFFASGMEAQNNGNGKEKRAQQNGELEFSGFNNSHSKSHQSCSASSLNKNPHQQKFLQQGQQFFLSESSPSSNNNPKRDPTASANALSSRSNLNTIRQQKHTILDHSVEEKNLQELMQNYTHMKSNYGLLMGQLKETSEGQYKIMSEMKKMKEQYQKKREEKLANVKKQKISRAEREENRNFSKKGVSNEEVEGGDMVQNTNSSRKKKREKLQEIKNEIHQLKEKEEKDIAYEQISSKIQSLENIVRDALGEVQEQKQKSQRFKPKIINYYSNQQYDNQNEEPSIENRNREKQGEEVNLSEQSSRMYEIDKGESYQNQHSRQSHHQRGQSQSHVHSNSPSQHHYPATTKNSPSKILNNANKYLEQPRSHSQSHHHPHSYSQPPHQNPPQHPHNNNNVGLSFDDFSSPLQLDLSVGSQPQHPNDTSYPQYPEQQENFDSIFQQIIQTSSPQSTAQQFLPLALDQTQTKNLRTILTQKSSVLYQSFQFLISCRYQLQPQDPTYPLVANIRISNKCAIDLLDVFVIVYGSYGQNIELQPNKVFEERLKYNTNLMFQVMVDQSVINDNGFYIQICYKTDSITKKKINFKTLLPMVQMIKPEFCCEENFIQSWNLFKGNEIYIRPRKLNFKHIRCHEDLKLILPLIDVIFQSDKHLQISEHIENIFSYGLMFKYPKSKVTFMLKIICYLNGTISIHMRTDRNGDQKLKEELLNIFAFLFLV